MAGGEVVLCPGPEEEALRAYDGLCREREVWDGGEGCLDGDPVFRRSSHDVFLIFFLVFSLFLLVFIR